MKIQKHKLINAVVISSITLLLLAGCSVSPQKLTKQEVTDVINHDRELLYIDQEPITEALSLGSVMARALIYNLEHRTQRMAQAVALGQFELAKYEMLPTLAGSAGLTSRNNTDASTSLSIFSGNESNEPTTSQEQVYTTSNLNLSWNILDFGVSYFQAKQDADRYLISDETRKRVLFSLLHQAQTTYWKAVTAQELQEPIQQGLTKSTQALADIDKGLEDGIYPNLLQPLELKKRLLETVAELETLQELLNQARVALASLINVPFDQLPHLKIPESFDVPEISASIEELEMTALINSTNLAEQIYSTRIERLETRKALLRLLPGIELNYGLNYNSNKYLYNNNWSEAGVQVTWNLMRLATTSQTLKNSDLREKLIEQKRLAVTMAVVTQLNISLQKYKASQKKLSKATALKDIDQLILEYSTNSAAIQSTSVIQEVSNEVGVLKTRMGYFNALSSAHEAYSSLWVALGLSLIPDNYQQFSLNTLSEYINQKLSNWNAGNLDLDVAITDESSETVEEKEVL